ncbi:hypothetical protein V495_00676 [Pseudogymnoascus sp. VKM F-4514 (FW-929)]|nr:hypothetical protein V495_00676 [Pseudogymnoascus sp. VKM F-4514 (FW-929)]KFY55254.1 hypothetical protein V497_07105 [Pseudogymnoascus sp. VKM F-4516 (FW-969)]
MSSRQIRKLQQQRELEQAKLREAAEEGSDEDEQEDYRPPAKASLFSSFAALQDEDNDDDDEDDEETKIDEKAHKSLDEAEPTPPKKAKKSKKKKKKAKSKAQETTEAQKPAAKDEGDDIDAALRELNISAEKAGQQPQQPIVELDPNFERMSALMGINSQHLKVGNEMRNLFGRTAVGNNDEAGGPVPRGGRRRQRGQQQVDLETALKGHHAPGKGLPELTLRRNIFIQGKEEWPRATTGGLTMEIVDGREFIDGTIEFRFVHDNAYEAVQNQFRMYVEMGDPQNLIGLLQRNPYHISLLLQVSKIAKDQSDHSLSNDLVERALFSFARASTSLFATKISLGKARLDFFRPENRELWLAGYHYIKSLTMKGTYRTAFEWAKLLLLLDQEDDPYCMKLVVHHLALRAHQFEWLIDASNSPMFDDGRGFTEDFQLSSVALAHMHLKHGAECREALGQAIRKFPYLFCLLFKELNLDDAPPSIWGIVPRNNAEELFSSIYINQTKDLWGTPEATALLVEVAHAVGKSDPKAIVPIPVQCINLDAARFVYLDNTPSLMSLVPSSLLHRIPNSDSDPLPPEAEMNIFSHPTQRLPFATGATGMAPDGGLQGFFDPVAAMRQLVPGWGTPPEPDNVPGEIGAAPIQELYERETENGEFAAVEALNRGDWGAAENVENLGSVRRLYRYLFGDRQYSTAEERAEGERRARELSEERRRNPPQMPAYMNTDDEFSSEEEFSDFDFEERREEDDEEGEFEDAEETHEGNTP